MKCRTDADVSDIQKCGLSMRKAGYIKRIGEAAVCGELDLSELKEMPDDGIIEKLSSFCSAIMQWKFMGYRPDFLTSVPSNQPISHKA